MKLTNTVIVVETEINDTILKEVKDLKTDHPDKQAVIDECVKRLKKSFPNMEIFEVGPTYIVTENAMYLALFKDEIELV